MLGKLLKYEIKSTARLILPLCALLILLAGIARVAFQFIPYDNEIAAVTAAFSGMFLMLIFMAIITAVFVMTFILTVYRFHKNLLSDEGYLMFTLPVTIHQNVLSKLIVALLWSFTSCVSVGLTCLIFIAGTPVAPEFWAVVKEILTTLAFESGVSEYLLIIEFIISALVTWVGSILKVYMALSIGHLVSKMRILASFGVYLGLSFVTSMINSVLQVFLTTGISYANPSFMDNTSFLHIYALPTMILSILFAFVYYFTTTSILKNKLNLE